MTKELIVAINRYLEVVNRNDDVKVVSMVSESEYSALVTLQGHCGETWEITAGLDSENRLYLDNSVSGQSVYDFAEEFEWSEKDVKYIMTGKV